ncbi:hypothetical protein HY469_00885 [Candidatus Roizmanbacteria bacterium]|nr:hypothetical protein [Candidatus Roizmanbacteria bacterium]
MRYSETERVDRAYVPFSTVSLPTVELIRGIRGNFAQVSVPDGYGEIPLTASRSFWQILTFDNNVSPYCPRGYQAFWHGYDFEYKRVHAEHLALYEVNPYTKESPEVSHIGIHTVLMKDAGEYHTGLFFDPENIDESPKRVSSIVVAKTPQGQPLFDYRRFDRPVEQRPTGIALVSSHPARILGLSDRLVQLWRARLSELLPTATSV